MCVEVEKKERKRQKEGRRERGRVYIFCFSEEEDSKEEKGSQRENEEGGCLVCVLRGERKRGGKRREKGEDGNEGPERRGISKVFWIKN